MKYMHAKGQHVSLSLANGLLLVQMFSQADKLRTVSQGMPGIRERKKSINNGCLNLNLKSNANPPDKYSGSALMHTWPINVD